MTQVHMLRDPGEEWTRVVAELDRQHIPVPLAARPEWVRTIGPENARLLVASRDGVARAAICLSLERTRKLPGHRVARARPVGAELCNEDGEAVIDVLADFARNENRLLSVTVECVTRTQLQGERLAHALARAGFRQVAEPRHYVETLVVDLGLSEERLLASFSETTRRDLRKCAAGPLELRTITDPRFSDRLNALARETFSRTGGAFAPQQWEARMALTRLLPARSHLVGMFRRGDESPDGLLAFASCFHHGDHAEYVDAGSTRVDDLKVSLATPLMWELIRWSRREGALWFDMGGVPTGAGQENQAREGIANFKRRFSKDQIAVGQEWCLEPHPVRSWLASAIGRANARLRR